MESHDIRPAPAQPPPGGRPTGLGHHCGVAAIRSPSPRDLGRELFYMLFSLQHRGQESCGAAFGLPDGAIAARKGLGMVAPVLGRLLEEENPAGLALGHVRYSTAGGGGERNVQPIVVDCSKGRTALAHNGNLSNGGRLREELTAAGSIFQGTADSELVLHLLSRSPARDREGFLRDALGRLEGAYSLAMIHEGALVAARDPWGYRPLLVAEAGGSTYVASETCAFAALGLQSWREIAPGEVLVVDDSGSSSFFLDRKPAKLERCVFELIYFARPDSEIFGESVHGVRARLGESLAELDLASGLEADVVVPVPDSGNIAAIGYARRSGLPFDFGLARSHYAGRSFILPSRGERELAARLKLHAVAAVVAGRRVVLIDDSLVRGTTSRIIVKLLREAGAREVHLRLAAPELRWPCHYGIDIPDREELVSNRLDPAGIARETGADSARFLDVERLLGTLREPGRYCSACFDGRHALPPLGPRKEGP